MPALHTRIRDYASFLNFPLALDFDSQIRKIVNTISTYGKVINLTSDLSEIALGDHLCESLQVVACAQALSLPGSSSWIDVGSGAGFPGLMVAALTNFPLTLVEPRERRASFLAMAARSLRPQFPDSVQILRARLESGRFTGVGSQKLPSTLPQAWTLASARAVWSPLDWLQHAQSILEPDGYAVVHAKLDFTIPQGWERAAQIDGPHWSTFMVRRSSSQASCST